MRKLMVLVAMLAIGLVVVVPVAASEFNQIVGEEITQDSELEAESGEVDQAFEVAGGGDNSDQCAGVQGVSNTAPVQGGTHIIQYNSEADEFEFEDVGGSSLNIIQADSEADNFEFDGEEGGPLTVGGANDTSCEQQANQAGSASG
jgi:hypothetical protein